MDSNLPLVYLAELDTYTPAVSTTPLKPGHATRAHLAPSVLTAPAASNTLRASDSGYRTGAGDSPALAVYPPRLVSAFAIDRKINLDPTGSMTGAAWGSISLSNAGGVYDSLVANSNSDGRVVSIRALQRTYDQNRGLYLDPPYSSTAMLFSGIAQPWSLTDTTLDVPLRDATYWLEKPVQNNLYLGTGGYNGSADLLGLPKPKTRGQVYSIQPVLIDPTNRIYQWNDGPGLCQVLYEGSDTNIGFQADTTNLYSGTTTSGYYRTDNSRGLIQLGTAPVRTITVDAYGYFPSAGAQTSVVQICKYLMTEDMSLPAGNLDTASFAAVNSTYGYTAGVFFGTTPVAGLTALNTLLSGAQLKLAPLRSGALAILALRDVTGRAPVSAISVGNAVSCLPVGLPSTVSPSPYRFRVGYYRNFSPAPTDISPNVTSMTRRSFLATEYRYASWASTAVLAAYRRPNDPDPITSSLANVANAQTVANDLGALWGVRRRLYAVVVPAVLALARELGDVVQLAWPVDDLRAGRLGQIVGEQFRSGDSVSTLYILV